MLFWDPRASLQLRVYGQVVVHHQDALAIAKMQQLPAGQLALFGYATPPGTPLTADQSPDFDAAIAARHFAWITVQATHIDALHLGRTGVHTRAAFTYRGTALHAMAYLMP